MTTTGGHRPLFIRDITSAWNPAADHSNRSSSNDKPSKVRINGVVVLDKSNDETGERRIWLDDSTDTICVVLTPRLCRRPDAEQLRLATSVTLYGTVDRLPSSEDKALVVRCGGFHVEHALNMETYHWIKAASHGSKVTSTSTTTVASDCQTPPDAPQSGANDQAVDNEEQRQLTHSVPHARFLGQHQTLLSQPSPNRGPTHHLLKPQLSITDDDLFNDFGDSDLWNWSPDHAVASSTPISRMQSTAGGNDSYNKGSPLQAQVYPLPASNAQQQHDDFDSFGFDGSFDPAELDALEHNAIQSRNGKRSFGAVE